MNIFIVNQTNRKGIMCNSCLVCSKPVTKRETLGFMETPKGGLAHYKCVVKYGYQKFVQETAQSSTLSDEEIRDRMAKWCDFMDEKDRLEQQKMQNTDKGT